MKLYRLLTGPEDATFCHKVSEALSKGWELYGSPSITAKNGEIVCAQAVTKDVDVVYSPDLKLGQQ